MGACAFRRARAQANVDWQGEQPAGSTTLDHDNSAPSPSAMLITPRGTHALMDIVEVQTSAKLQRALLDGQRERDRADRLQLEVDLLRARYAAQSTRASARNCHQSPPPTDALTRLAVVVLTFHPACAAWCTVWLGPNAPRPRRAHASQRWSKS